MPVWRGGCTEHAGCPCGVNRCFRARDYFLVSILTRSGIMVASWNTETMYYAYKSLHAEHPGPVYAVTSRRRDNYDLVFAMHNSSSGVGRKYHPETPQNLFTNVVRVTTWPGPLQHEHIIHNRLERYGRAYALSLSIWGIWTQNSEPCVVTVFSSI